MGEYKQGLDPWSLPLLFLDVPPRTRLHIEKKKILCDYDTKFFVTTIHILLTYPLEGNYTPTEGVSAGRILLLLFFPVCFIIGRHFCRIATGTSKPGILSDSGSKSITFWPPGLFELTKNNTYIFTPEEDTQKRPSSALCVWKNSNITLAGILPF